MLIKSDNSLFLADRTFLAGAASLPHIDRTQARVVHTAFDLILWL